MENNEKPIAKFLRLQNGDDVIAEVIETEDEHGISYTLFHPLKVVYMPSESAGYLSVAFMPWVFPRICDQQEFVINGEDILILVDVAEKMNIYYWDSVNSYMQKTDVVEKEENEEETQKLYKALMEQLGNKRTLH